MIDSNTNKTLDKFRSLEKTICGISTGMWHL